MHTCINLGVVRACVRACLPDGVHLSRAYADSACGCEELHACTSLFMCARAHLSHMCTQRTCVCACLQHADICTCVRVCMRAYLKKNWLYARCLCGCVQACVNEWVSKRKFMSELESKFISKWLSEWMSGQRPIKWAGVWIAGCVSEGIVWASQ